MREISHRKGRGKKGEQQLHQLYTQNAAPEQAAMGTGGERSSSRAAADSWAWCILCKAVSYGQVPGKYWNGQLRLARLLLHV